MTVSLSDGLASGSASRCPSLFNLELWHQDRLLSGHCSSGSYVLALPASLPGAADVAAELQNGLPRVSGDADDLNDFVRDLGHWMCRYCAPLATQGEAAGWQVCV